MEDRSGQATSCKLWQINDLLVDLSRHVVIHQSGEKRLEPKVAHVLSVLIESANAVVSRQVLVDTVWEHAFGADQSLTNAISQLRKSLDFGDESVGLIETVPKAGYRLVANVSAVDDGEDATAIGRFGSQWSRIVVSLVVVAVFAIAFVLLRAGLRYEDLDDYATERPASNLRAFDAYERGRQAFAVPTTDNLRKSIGLLEQAVAQDPEFAAAWAELAVAYQRAPSWLIRDRDYSALARRAAKKALVIDREQALAHAVLGVSVVETAPVDYSAAIGHLSNALQLDPTNAVALHWRGIAYTSTGFFEKAQADFSRCIEAHPNNGSCIGWFSFSSLCSGDMEHAFELFESAAEDGIRTHLGAFAKAYAVEGQRTLAILTWAWDFSGSAIDADRLYRAHTDPDFDHAEEAAKFAVEYAAAKGRPLDWGKPGAIDAAHTFKRYETLEAVWWYPVWWLRMHDDFLTSDARTRLMSDHGLFDYWDAVGPPQHCTNDSILRYVCN